MGREPGKHRLKRCGDVEVVVGLLLCLHKCVEQRCSDPAVALVDLAPDHYRVHHRENPGVAEVGLLDFLVVCEEPADPAAANGER